MNTKIWAIVPAAGIGTRFGSELPKQYYELGAKPIIIRTLERLGGVDRISGIGVGISPDDTTWARVASELPEAVWSFVGGSTRLETVSNGLDELVSRGEGGAWVLVHDAVRPCVCAEDVNRLIDAVDFQAPGGLLASPVNDTLKAADEATQVAETIPRANLWRAQTPQLFPVRLLQEALIQAGNQKRDCTDDAQAIEQLGLHPKLVTCADHNLKITQRSDLTLARAILSQQESTICSG